MKAYEILVEQVLKKLEAGSVPWRKPWVGRVPCNYVTQREYRGFNRLVLAMSDFEDHRFLTHKQIQDLGGRLQKGSIGIKIFFFRVEEDEQTQESYPILRYYQVYNISQTLGIEKIPSQVSPLGMHARAQQIVTNYKDKPHVYHTGRASYNLETDTVTIPSLCKFKKDEEYFSTLFHEFIHSTGSPQRLGRFGMEQVEYFGSENYSKEELVAELGSMFLCMEAGIIQETQENSQAYIAGWLGYLRGHKKELIDAARLAQNASEYILGSNIASETLSV